MKQKQQADNFLPVSKVLHELYGGQLRTEMVTGRLTVYSHDINVLSNCVNNGFIRKFYVFIYLSVGKGDILATQI